MYNLLKQREEVYDKNWILKEAMDAKGLLNGGTFWNALSRKINDVILPIFTAIIGFVDFNCNLDLVVQGPPSISKLWLAMFENNQIMQFNYDKIATRKWRPRRGGRMEFKCRLPFSWIIKDAVDSQWENAQHQSSMLYVHL